MSWTPNPNAKQIYPTNISHKFNIRCFTRAWNFCMKRSIRKCFKWLLVFILILTIMVNVVFVMNIKPKHRNDLYGLPKNGRFEEKRVINMGKYIDKHYFVAHICLDIDMFDIRCLPREDAIFSLLKYALIFFL